MWFCLHFTFMLELLFKVGHNFPMSFRHLDFRRTSIVSLRERCNT